MHRNKIQKLCDTTAVELVAGGIRNEQSSRVGRGINEAVTSHRREMAIKVVASTRANVSKGPDIPSLRHLTLSYRRDAHRAEVAGQAFSLIRCVGRSPARTSKASSAAVLLMRRMLSQVTPAT